MSFTIKFQTNNSENISISKDLTDVISMDGTLKEGTSIIDPVIKIECDLSQIAKCNYMTIETFKRSYFITDIKSIRNGLCEISAHVDVLTSFASEIKSNRGIVKRQENKWNLYVDDGSFKTYQNPIVLTKAFPTGFTKQEFVLAVAGS